MLKSAPHIVLSSSAQADDPVRPVLGWWLGFTCLHGRGVLDAPLSRGMTPCLKGVR